MGRNHDVNDERPDSSCATSSSLIGFCAAVSTLGGVGINLALRESYLRSGIQTWFTWTMYACRTGAHVMKNAGEGNVAAIAR